MPDEISGSPGEPSVATEPAGRAWIPAAVVASVLLLLVGAGVTYLLVSSSTVFVYSKLVDEVMAQPSAFSDRELRVEGQLRQGSIQYREEPCEYRFVLERGGRQMPVRYGRCVVPDTFRDGMGISVTVRGRLLADGNFEAVEVVPRCPSRYEMQERQKAGETMPHAAPVTTI